MECLQFIFNCKGKLICKWSIRVSLFIEWYLCTAWSNSERRISFSRYFLLLRLTIADTWRRFRFWLQFWFFYAALTKNSFTNDSEFYCWKAYAQFDRLLPLLFTSKSFFFYCLWLSTFLLCLTKEFCIQILWSKMLVSFYNKSF